MLNSRRAFTLVELIIVFIIIGIVASIALPLMQDMKARAIATEAAITMSSCVTALQLYCIENPGVHFVFRANYTPEEPPGLEGQLTGHYFSKECYAGSVGYPTNSTIFIECVFSMNTAAKSETDAITDNKDGDAIMYLFHNYPDQPNGIYQDGVSKSGYQPILMSK